MSNNKKTTVRRITPQDPEYWTQDTGPVVARGTPYVPAQDPNIQPAPLVRRNQPINVDLNMPQQATMVVEMRTTAVDRARGFTIETHQLSIVVGLLAVLVAVVGRGQPIFTVGTLFIFLLWYTIVWAGAWLIHRFISPEGIAAFNAVMSWVYLFRRG